MKRVIKAAFLCLLWLCTLCLVFSNLKMKAGIEQLSSQVDMLMQNVQMTRMTVRDQPFRASVSDVLTRTDAQIIMASFSTDGYASAAKSLSTLCDKELKQSTGGVSNESVKAEMQRRPGMYGRLVIPSVSMWHYLTVWHKAW